MKDRCWFLCFAIASLLVAVLMMTLWVRSYWVVDALWYGEQSVGMGSDKIGIASETGRMMFVVQRDHSGMVVPNNRVHYAAWVCGWPHLGDSMTRGMSFRKVYWDCIGFHFVDDFRSYNQRTLYFGAPHWFVAILSLLPAFIWFWAKHRRRRGPGLCNSCGYDLRASTGNCPECGAAIPMKSKDAGNSTPSLSKKEQG
ncbi:MAG: hypothetical protein K8S99_01100 [Planctomycetes bacterium]|nr:hypothetical protein [Planctomycetota bacterium]